MTQQSFYIEVTDTYGGEANYCWVHRFKVWAKSPLGAIRKVSRETGLSFRNEWNCGEESKYKAIGACVCAFVIWWDEENYQHYTVKEI